MTKDEALRLALEALESGEKMQNGRLVWIEHDISLVKQAIPAIKAALEAKDEPVGLIESLKDAKPCCGQYETCWRACTPRGKFIGQRDAQRTWAGLTDEHKEGLIYMTNPNPEPHHLRELIDVVEFQLKEKNT
jgi:hypothetical protein